jgi:hypothetical protein
MGAYLDDRRSLQTQPLNTRSLSRPLRRCRAAVAAFKTLGVGWFDVDALPLLSLGRVNHRQLERALAQLASGFDLRGCAAD